MPTSQTQDMEAQLAADTDGAYKEELLQLLKKHKDQLSFERQGFLPPDEYQVVEHMEHAVDAAISVVQDCGPVESEPTETAQSSAFDNGVNI